MLWGKTSRPAPRVSTLVPFINTCYSFFTAVTCPVIHTSLHFTRARNACGKMHMCFVCIHFAFAPRLLRVCTSFTPHLRLATRSHALVCMSSVQAVHYTIRAYHKGVDCWNAATVCRKNLHCELYILVA